LGQQPNQEGQKTNAHDQGRSISSEVDELRKHLGTQDPLHRITLLKEVDVYEQLKLRENLPQADKSGFFTLKISEYDSDKQERFGSIKAWGKILPISEPSITTRLKGKNGITGKDSIGHILKNGFYAESLVRECCADLLQDVPQCDDQGFFMKTIGEGEQKKEERYGHIQAWVKALGLTADILKSRLKGKSGIIGKGLNGHIIKNGFYAEMMVRELCKDALQDMPLADDQGFFMKIIGEGEQMKEERFGSTEGWMRILGISSPTIRKRLKGKNGITAKYRINGHIIQNGFYAESVVRECCTDLLEDMPQANEDGFFIKTIREGKQMHQERYGSIRAWERLLSISEGSISKRLKGELGITGKDPGGRPLKNGYYPESLVRNLCEDLLQDIPQANAEGFFLKTIGEGEQIKQERYASTKSWSRILMIDRGAIKAKLVSEVGITGKDQGGRVLKNGFYGESVIRELCVDLIEKRNHQTDQSIHGKA
jgi:hypothetical protein